MVGKESGDGAKQGERRGGRKRGAYVCFFVFFLFLIFHIAALPKRLKRRQGGMKKVGKRKEEVTSASVRLFRGEMSQIVLW